MKKRGLSPVIATVILISIALILAIIIFLWARGFVSEKTQKFGSPIEFACEDVNFDAEVFLDSGILTIDVVNRGDVPLYGIELRKGGFGSVDVETSEKTLANGDTGSYEFQYSDSEGEVTIVPIIIGESGDTKKAYTCDEKYGLIREA